MIPFGLGHIVQFVFRGVQRAGSDFVQQGFPDMGQVGVDQYDLGGATLAQGFTQAGRQFEAASAPANDDNTVSHGDIS
ncbi:hypothetical protein D3C80_1159210 [compost metagenome]